MSNDVKRLTLEPHRNARFEEIRVGEAFYFRGEFWVKTSSTYGRELIGQFDVGQLGNIFGSDARVQTAILGRQ